MCVCVHAHAKIRLHAFSPQVIHSNFCNIMLVATKVQVVLRNFCSVNMDAQ